MPDITHILSDDIDYKGSEWSLSGSPTNKAEFDEGFTMQNLNGKKTPTWDDLQTKLTVVQAAYDAKEYKRQRQPEYPAIREQLDLLWHAIDDGTLDKTSDFYTSLKATKDKYPKP